MKKICLLLVSLVFLAACTRIELSEDKIIIKDTANTAKSNSTLIKNNENKIAEKMPSLESSLDTPAIVENRIIDETDSIDFGDVA